MSGILGLLERSGKPLCRRELLAMRQRMSHWGPDGNADWHDRHYGIGFLQKNDSPDYSDGGFPKRSHDGQFVFAATARLDNRDDLLATLPLNKTERNSYSDGQLLMAAYAKWGEEAPTKLFGDWSFAAWHPRERRLFLARDHLGITSMFYFQNQHRFAFASDHRALAALSDVPRQLNEMFLGQVLIGDMDFQGAQTIWKDFMILPPAHCLTVTQDTLQVRQYWNVDHLSERSFRNEDELTEEFLHHYRRAVQTRVDPRKRIAVTLSGGLDSGSVAALASERLSAGKDHNPLLAFTAVPKFTSGEVTNSRRFGNEWEAAALVARQHRITSHFAVDGSRVSLTDGIQQALDLFGMPVYGVSNAYWIFELLQEATNHGTETLLIGQGGNATVSFAGLRKSASPWQLLCNGQLLAAAKSACRPFDFRERLTGIRSAWRFGDPLLSNRPWRRFCALRPDVVRRLQLDTKSIVAPSFPNATAFKRALLRLGGSHIGMTWRLIAAKYGIQVCDPTHDIRLLEFCYSIPNSYFFSESGMNRWVIRRAMTGILPDEVRLNQRIGLQGADNVERVRRDHAKILSEIETTSKSSLAHEFLDLRHLRRSLELALSRNDMFTLSLCGGVVLRGLQAGIFLRQIEADRGLETTALVKAA